MSSDQLQSFLWTQRSATVSLNYPKNPFKTDCQFIVCLPKCLQKSAEAIRNPISSKVALLRFSNGSCGFLFSWLFLLSCYTAGRKAEAGKHFPGSSPQTGFWKHLTPNIWLSASPISVCWRLYSLASSHPSEDRKIKALAHISSPDPISCQK